MKIKHFINRLFFTCLFPAVPKKTAAVLFVLLLAGTPVLSGCGHLPGTDLLPNIDFRKNTEKYADEEAFDPGETPDSESPSDYEAPSVPEPESDTEQNSDPESTSDPDEPSGIWSLFDLGDPSGGETEVTITDDPYIAEDIFGNRYVNIPEDTVLIIHDGDVEKTRLELAQALADRAGSVCIKNQDAWFGTPDFYAMPYSTFWLDTCSGEALIGKEKGADESASYHFYNFTYFDYSEEEIDEMKAAIDAAAGNILAQIPEDADDWTKALIVHDELCRLITYDKTLEAPHCHDTYGALVGHNAVCSGYACAFSHIMSLLGMYCPLSYSDDHAWNYVAVPSNEAYIDVTWDDPDLYDAYGDAYINHNHFFLTREEVESIDSHSIESMDPFSETEDPLPYNYYSHTGTLLDSYDVSVIVDLLWDQYVSGSNLLSLRFRNFEDYNMALTWKDNDGEMLQYLLGELGYSGVYYYWYNDDMQTVSFGLYAPEE